MEATLRARVPNPSEDAVRKFCSSFDTELSSDDIASDAFKLSSGESFEKRTVDLGAPYRFVDGLLSIGVTVIRPDTGVIASVRMRQQYSALINLAMIIMYRFVWISFQFFVYVVQRIGVEDTEVE